MDILCIVALLVAVLALPTVFQMIWGRPKVLIRFTTAPLPDATGTEVLWCELTNPPIRNRLLRRLFVRRMPAEDVTARYHIRDTQGSNPVFNATPLIATESPYGLASAQRIRLTASGAPFTFRTVTIDTATRRGEVFAIPRDGERVPLGSGLYEASVELSVDGDALKPITKRFVVRDTSPYAYWEPGDD